MSEEMKMNVNQQDLPITSDTSDARSTRAEVISLHPLTDIHESKQAAVLSMDLPGVSRDALDIDVDNNVLTVKAAVNLHTPEGLTPSYMEMHSGVYERRFTLGDELDSANIEAHLKDGVLTLMIPLMPQHQPRKIEVKVA